MFPSFVLYFELDRLVNITSLYVDAHLRVTPGSKIDYCV